MRRFGISFHVIERDWTYAQFRFVLRGIRLNQEAEARAYEEAREGRPSGFASSATKSEGRPLSGVEAAAMAQFLPASMVAEAMISDR